MKFYRYIVLDYKAPSDTNTIWWDSNTDTFKVYDASVDEDDSWVSITVNPETAEKLKNMADDLSSVYQEILIPGEGITIDDNNVISVNVDFDQYATNNTVGCKLNIFDYSGSKTFIKPGTYNLGYAAVDGYKFYYNGTLYDIPNIGEKAQVGDMPYKIDVTRTGRDEITIREWATGYMKAAGGVSFGVPVSIPEEIVNTKNKVESTIVAPIEPTPEFPYATRGELTELSSEVSGLSERIDNLPTAESSVFEAEYNKTTFAEIVEAYNAGKSVTCRHGQTIAQLISIADSVIYFTSIDIKRETRFICYSSNTWTYNDHNTGHELKTLDNGNAQITIAGKTAEVVTPQNVGKQGVVKQTQGWSLKDGVYSYTMKNVVIGLIPQASIDLFTRVGAVFNEESGYFEMNSLTDISYEEMMDIYTYGNVPTLSNIEQYCPIKDIRTTLPIRANNYYNQNMSPSFEYATVESLFLTNDASPVNAEGLGNGAKYLHTLVIPDYSRGKKFWSVIKQLRTCLIAKIKANIELTSSYQLTNESILYMIQNEAATSAITLTLHADAYGRAMADSEIQAALTAHPNVSLAK